MKTLNFLTSRWQRQEADSPFFLSVTFDKDPVDKYFVEFLLTRVDGSNLLRGIPNPMLQWTALTAWKVEGKSNYKTIRLGLMTRNPDMYEFLRGLGEFRREKTKNRPRQLRLFKGRELHELSSP